MADRRQKLFRLRAKACQALESVPGPVDTAPLEAGVRILREAAASARKLSTRVSQIQSRIGAAEQALRDWAKTNPLCPTCGAAVDAERLIAGGHDHG